MMMWRARESFDVRVVGARLLALLMAVTAYYVAVGLGTRTAATAVLRRGRFRMPTEWGPRTLTRGPPLPRAVGSVTAPPDRTQRSGFPPLHAR
jgi:hypothetical protein